MPECMIMWNLRCQRQGKSPSNSSLFTGFVSKLWMQPLCRVQLKQSTIHYPLRKLEPNLHVSSDSVLIDMYSIFGSVGHCHTRNVITWLQTLTRCNSNYHIGRTHHLQVMQQMSTEKSQRNCKNLKSLHHLLDIMPYQSLVICIRAQRRMGSLDFKISRMKSL